MGKVRDTVLWVGEGEKERQVVRRYIGIALSSF
jgi:hypothetical protein